MSTFLKTRACHFALHCFDPDLLFPPTLGLELEDEGVGRIPEFSMAETGHLKRIETHSRGAPRPTIKVFDSLDMSHADQVISWRTREIQGHLPLPKPIS